MGLPIRPLATAAAVPDFLAPDSSLMVVIVVRVVLVVVVVLVVRVLIMMW